MNLVYWLLCIIIGALPAALVYRSDKRKDFPIKWLPAVLRWLTISTTAALLLAPAFPFEKTEEEKPLIIWLQDNSSSIQQALAKDSNNYIQEAQALQQKLGQQYETVQLGFGDRLMNDSIYAFDQPITDISNALKMVISRYEDRNIGAVIVASDGIYNQGADPHYLHIKKQIPVYTIGLGDSTSPRDALINRVMANKVVTKGSTFEILVDLKIEKFSGRQTKLRLTKGGKTLQNTTIKVDRDRLHHSLSLETVASESGLQKYSLVLEAFEEEENKLNNQMDFYVDVVAENSKILLLAQGPHPDIAAIGQALESVPNFSLDVRVQHNAPNNWEEYKMVIAYQLPSSMTVNIPKDMPVWFILGNSTHVAAFNQQQSALTISGAARPNAVLPVLNNNFNYFSLPTNIKEVLTKMPPLHAPHGDYHATGQVLLKQQIGNIPTDHALWLIQTGNPSVAVLAGEGIWRWRIYEYKNFNNHLVVDELIRQTISLLQSKKEERQFRVFLDNYLLSENEPVYIFAELRNENGELVNQPEVSISLSDSSGQKLNLQFEKSGNRYRLNPGLLSAGSWSYRSRVNYNGKTATAAGQFTISATPLEDLRSHADFELLHFLAAQSQAAFFTVDNMSALSDSLQNNASLKPVLHSSRSYQSLIDWRWLFGFILLTATLEWLLRKYWNLN